MDQKYSDIVYKDSPFSPRITYENYLRIRQNSTTIARPYSVAISFEICEMAIQLNRYHGADLGWITSTFNASVKDIDLFMFGFTMAPTLIIGSHIINVLSVAEAFKRICPPTKDELELDISIYKCSHLINCYMIFKTLEENKQGGLDIFNYCREKPYSQNRFYLAGIESSEKLYLDFFHYFETLQ